MGTSFITVRWIRRKPKAYCCTRISRHLAFVTWEPPAKAGGFAFLAERDRQLAGESPLGPRMRSNAPFLSRSISGERSVSAFDKRIGLRRATFLGSAWIDVGFANLGKLGVGGFLFIQG